MKARVKATGKTIDVEQFAEGVYVSTFDEDVYLEESLDFWGNASSNLDYWTRLEHHAAIAAMQGLLANPAFWKMDWSNKDTSYVDLI